jgi:hypothetical protein
MTDERRFGPKTQGQRDLAFLLVAGALGLIYLAAIHTPLILPPDPRYRGDMYLLLLAAVLMLGAIPAWRWKQYQAEIVVSDEGLRFWSKGPRWVRPTELPWDHIDRMEHRVIHVPKGSDISILVFKLGDRAAKPGREIEFVTNGLENDRSAVVAAITEFAQRTGIRVVGPRAEHVAAWFDGMNWRFERAD